VSAGLPANPVVQRLELLLTGVGYNYYRAENQARADDQLVRQKASHALADSVAALARLHTDYQRAYIPSPSRDHPFPPREEMERARQIKALRERIEGLDGLVRGMPVPTADKTWARFRQELSSLTQLLDVDCRLIEACEVLHAQASVCTPLSWRSGEDAILLTAALERIEGVVRDRARLLSAPF
jgi:hypothetical protein